MQKSDRIRAEVSLREMADKAGLSWDHRKSTPRRGDYWAPCPFHQEKTSSFHVVEPNGTGGFCKCFGCGFSGSVIDFCMEFWGVDFTDTVRRLAAENCLNDELTEDRRAALKKRQDQARAQSEAEAKRTAQNGHRKELEIWRAATTPDKGDTEGVRWGNQAARGVKMSVIGGIPATIRYARDLPHKEGGRLTHTGPAMVTAIGRDKILGVHRTWITRKARARHADGRKVSKQWIGRTGELMGQPAVLCDPRSGVVVGEGLETTLAAWSGLVRAGHQEWCAEAARLGYLGDSGSFHRNLLVTANYFVEKLLIRCRRQGEVEIDRAGLVGKSIQHFSQTGVALTHARCIDKHQAVLTETGEQSTQGKRALRLKY